MLGYWIIGQSQVFKEAMSRPCLDPLDAPIYRKVLTNIFIKHIEKKKVHEKNV